MQDRNEYTAVGPLISRDCAGGHGVRDRLAVFYARRRGPGDGNPAQRGRTRHTDRPYRRLARWLLYISLANGDSTSRQHHLQLIVDIRISVTIVGGLRLKSAGAAAHSPSQLEAITASYSSRVVSTASCRKHMYLIVDRRVGEGRQARRGARRRSCIYSRRPRSLYPFSIQPVHRDGQCRHASNNTESDIFGIVVGRNKPAA